MGTSEQGDGPALALRGVSVTFGVVRAVDGVDLDVAAGSLTGLIGPNGAGKTTLIDATSGFVPASGEVRLGGRRLDGLPPHRRAAAGLGRTWQSVEAGDDLTVRERCLVAAQPQALWAVARDALGLDRARPDPERVTWALDLLGLGADAHRRPGELPLGRRKLVGVAAALAGDPTVVLLDEPAAGLDTAESAALGEHLRAVVAAGTTVVLVDHDMGLVLGVCDQVHVLDAGRVLCSGPPEQVRADERVVAAYLGQSAGAAAGAPHPGASP